jgi:hypothetical protein
MEGARLAKVENHNRFGGALIMALNEAKVPVQVRLSREMCVNNEETYKGLFRIHKEGYRRTTSWV